MQKVKIPNDESVSDEGSECENTNESVLDPRAGKVDVVLPQLKFRAKSMVELFNEQKCLKETSSEGRKALTKLIQQ